MRSRIALTVLLIALLPGCCVQPPPVPPPTKPIPPDAIQIEIDLLRKDLLEHQSDWLWPTVWDRPSIQRAAFATYALLASGSSSEDPSIRAAVEWLKRLRDPDPSARSARMKIWLLLWQQTHDKNFEAFAAADASSLLSASLDDLHEAPILYLAGNQRIDLSAAAVAKLRLFVLEGGMIVGNADCASGAFDKSFKELGEKMFPRYEFRVLGRDHLIYSGEAYRASKMRGQQSIFSLSNGVRELMLLLPTGDPARAWQQNAFFARTDAFQIGAGIVGYATDLAHLRRRGDSYIVRPDFAVTPTRAISVARLMVGENPDPEPGGWLRLAAILHNAPYKIDLRVTPMKPGESLAGYQVVHLTGTTRFMLSPAERQALFEFTAHGGTLIVDAAGGAKEFADSAETELAAIFGEDATRPLPLESAVYHLPDADIASVSYRRFARRNLVGNANIPHVYGIVMKNRIVAFYSHEDISAGLVGEPIDGIDGYTPQSATDLMRNLVLFAGNY